MNRMESFETFGCIPKFKLPLAMRLAKYTPVIGAFLLCAVVVFFASVLRVNAEETGANYTTIVKRLDVVYNGANCDVVEYRLYSNSELICYNASGQTYFTTINNMLGISEQVTYDSFGDGVPVYTNSVANVPIAFNESYGNIHLEVFCKYFSSYESALAYCNTGSLDGLVNVNPDDKTEINKGFYSYEYRVNYYDDWHDRNEYFYITFSSPYELVFFINTENNRMYMTSPALENDVVSSFEIKVINVNNDGPTGEENSSFYYDYLSVPISIGSGPVVGDTDENLTYSVTGKLFDSYESALAYCQSGDDSGQVNKPDEIGHDSLYLTGFTCDNTIEARWTGLGTDLKHINYDKVYVEVSPLYLCIVENGEEYVSYSGPGDIIVPYNDFVFYKSYDEYFADCPYSQCSLLLRFTPLYYEGDSYFYRGQSTVMEFSLDGEFEGVVYPSIGLVEEFDPTCQFVYPYFNQKGYDYYMCGWDDITARHSENEILETYIKVEIIDDVGVVHEYSRDYYWTDSFLKLDINKIMSFLKAEGVEKWAVIQNIRITPYYRTSTCLHYGRSLLASFENNKDISNLQVSLGDGFNDEDELGYGPVATQAPLEVETVVPDIGSDDIEWSLDVMTENLFVMLKNLVSYCGQIPALVSQVFGFLPGVYSSMIVVAFGVCVILRILGR